LELWTVGGLRSYAGGGVVARDLTTTFWTAKKLPPGFEPGSLDSKSRVLTITPWERIACLKELVKSSSYGDRTHDPWLIRPMLYHLS
jgi:hypothetical protein